MQPFAAGAKELVIPPEIGPSRGTNALRTTDDRQAKIMLEVVQGFALIETKGSRHQFRLNSKRT